MMAIWVSPKIIIPHFYLDSNDHDGWSDTDTMHPCFFRQYIKWIINHIHVYVYYGNVTYQPNLQTGSFCVFENFNFWILTFFFYSLSLPHYASTCIMSLGCKFQNAKSFKILQPNLSQDIPWGTGTLCVKISVFVICYFKKNFQRKFQNATFLRIVNFGSKLFSRVYRKQGHKDIVHSIVGSFIPSLWFL